MLSRRVAQILIVCVALSLSGCSTPDEKRETELVAGSFFNLYNSQDYDALYVLFEDEFFETVSKSEWKLTLERLHAHFGPITSFDLQKWKMEYKLPFTRNIWLKYDVRFSEDSAIITFYLRPASSGPRIAGWRINREIPGGRPRR